MPKYSTIPPKADHLAFAAWAGEEWLFPSADAIRTAIAAHGGGGAVTPYAQLAFVDHNNAAAVRDGSLTSPYRSITEAQAAITTATNINRVQLLVFPGVYVENVALKPYISIRGAGRESTQIQGILTLTAPGRIELAELTLTGQLQLNSAAFADASVFDMHRVDVLGAVVVAGRGPGSDGLAWDAVRVFGGSGFMGVSLHVSNSYFYGDLDLYTGGTVPSGGNLLSVALKGVYCSGAVNAAADPGHTGTVRFWTCTLAGDVDFTNAGTALIGEFDAPSWPQGDFTVAGNPTINRLNLAVNTFTVAAGATETLYRANAGLIRAVELVVAIDIPAESRSSSLLLHAVHDGTTGYAKVSEVGATLAVVPAVGLIGADFAVTLTNNEGNPLNVRSRVIDV